jgi:hypothetical protein
MIFFCFCKLSGDFNQESRFDCYCSKALMRVSVSIGSGFLFLSYVYNFEDDLHGFSRPAPSI